MVQKSQREVLRLLYYFQWKNHTLNVFLKGSDNRFTLQSLYCKLFEYNNQNKETQPKNTDNKLINTEEVKERLLEVIKNKRNAYLSTWELLKYLLLLIIKEILDTFTISMDENYITKQLLEY